MEQEKSSYSQVLPATKASGCCALPNFHFYYWSANIRCITQWLHAHLQQTGPAWLPMDAASCQPTSLQSQICSSLSLSVSQFSNNPLLKHSLLMWTQFRQPLGFQSISMLSPTVANHHFVPSGSDPSFHTWHRNGLKCLKDLYIDSNFASFEQLSLKCNKPRTHFFCCLQIQNFVRLFSPTSPTDSSAVEHPGVCITLGPKPYFVKLEAHCPHPYMFTGLETLCNFSNWRKSDIVSVGLVTSFMLNASLSSLMMRTWSSQPSLKLFKCAFLHPASAKSPFFFWYCLFYLFSYGVVLFFGRSVQQLCILYRISKNSCFSQFLQLDCIRAKLKNRHGLHWWQSFFFAIVTVRSTSVHRTANYSFLFTWQPERQSN